MSASLAYLPTLAARRLEKRRQAAESQSNIPQQVDPPDPIAWIQGNFYIPELRGPIQLYPHQIAVLREANRKDEQGKYIYNVIVWSDIKKSAKSCIAAANAFYRARHLDWGSIKIIANDLKQADSRVAFYFRRALELHPKYEKGYVGSDKIGYRQAGYTITFTDNNTTIEALPIDPGGEAGGNDDLIIFSELWAAKDKAIQQMWTEMTLSPTKFGYSQRWVETYAGFDGESPLLERLYQRGVGSGQRLDLSYTDAASGDHHDLADLEVYAADGLLCLWNDRPRLPFQSAEYYAQEEQDLLPSEFLRVHRNQWVASVEKFIELIWWDACKVSLPPLTKGEPVVIALDAAKGSETTRPADCFAVVAVTRRPGTPEHIAVRYCGIWQAEKGKLLDFAPIEAEIRRLCRDFSVIEVAYDPYQLHDMAMRLRREGVGNFKEFNQASQRLKADKQLRDLITAGRLAHDGNPLLREHIDNANVKNHGEDGIRIMKRNPDKKVDSAVALSMATARSLYFNLG